MTLRSLLLLGTLAASLAGCQFLPAQPLEPKPPPEPTPELSLEAPRMRRLLARQYVNSVKTLLGSEAAEAASPPADISAQGFESIGASLLTLSPAAVMQYETSARAVAAAAREDGAFGQHLGCTPSYPDDEDCFREFVRTFGRLAFRRALAEDEVERYTAVAMAAAQDLEYGEFDDGLEFAVAGMLQSPYFLFRTELGEGVPGTKNRKLTGYEMATRLSYFLNDTTPDDALLDLAEAGDLSTAQGVRDAAEVLLAKPQAKAALRALYGERFRVRDVTGLQKDPTEFPEWNGDLAASMEESAMRLFDEIVWTQDADWKDLLDAQYAFVDARLAAIYGVEPPAQGFARVDLPAEHGRAGILTQAATMALLAHPRFTSPTRRGKWVQERILCREIQPPPPDVDTAIPPDPPDGPQTMREKLEQHQTDPQCASCHQYLDNVGFGLEHFDPIGRWRATDQGLPIDDAGDLAPIGPFDGARGLAALLREQPASDRCLVQTFFRHGTGHAENSDEKAALDALTLALQTNGGRVQSLLLDLVASDVFRYVGADRGVDVGVSP